MHSKGPRSEVFCSAMREDQNIKRPVPGDIRPGSGGEGI
jgi:hypothetical protein